MKHSLFKLLSLVLFITTAFICKAQEVPYQEAKNYFVNNTYPDQTTHVLRITSEKKFNEIFGMAALMGDEGKPTEINFSKNFVIALIDAVSNETESIIIKNLANERKKLNLRYAILKREVPSFATFRFAKILIVNKKYKAPVIANLSNSKNVPMVGADQDEFGCKPSAGYSWSVLEENCTQPFNSKYNLIGSKINSSGNASLQFDKKLTKAEIIGSSFSPNIILTKDGEKDVWTDGQFTLEQQKKDVYILKQNGKEIAIGKLRN